MCGEGNKSGKAETLRGFLFNGIASGIKKNGAKDLGIIFSEVPATVAGVFTANTVKAAPLMISQERIKGGIAQAVLVNSGNANACTGEKGMKGALQLSSVLSRKINVAEEKILFASTGIIGVHLPVDTVKKSIPTLVNGLSPYKINEFALSILTTDTFPKIVMKKISVGRKAANIWGVAKGAGMIMPNMATMLAFLMTDAAIHLSLLRSLLKKGVDQSFNRITIDGDMSTNDMVIVLANGMAGNSIISSDSQEARRFGKCLFSVLSELSRMVVKDGEGATKLVEIRVEKAKSVSEARIAAYAIANSLLVKTALFGEEVNWGRILAVLGRCGETIDPAKIDISYGGIGVVKHGVSTGFERKAEKVMKQKEFTIVISLNRGKGVFQVLTTDLTPEYVKINASYRS